MASCSGRVTQSLYLAFTAVWRATYSHLNALFAGSHASAEESDFCWLAGPSADMRFKGSFASWRRCSALICWAPVCQAKDNGMMWSIWTAAEFWPRVKLMGLPVYLSASFPEAMTQSLVPGLVVTSVRSRRRMSLRVSQPLWSTSG